MEAYLAEASITLTDQLLFVLRTTYSSYYCIFKHGKTSSAKENSVQKLKMIVTIKH